MNASRGKEVMQITPRKQGHRDGSLAAIDTNCSSQGIMLVVPANAKLLSTGVHHPNQQADSPTRY